MLFLAFFNSVYKSGLNNPPPPNRFVVGVIVRICVTTDTCSAILAWYLRAVFSMRCVSPFFRIVFFLLQYFTSEHVSRRTLCLSIWDNLIVFVRKQLNQINPSAQINIRDKGAQIITVRIVFDKSLIGW